MVNYLLNENETRFKPNLFDGGLTFQTSAEKTLRWPIYVINSVDKTK